MRIKGKPKDKMDEMLFALGKEHESEPKEALIEKTVRMCTELAASYSDFDFEPEREGLKEEKLSYIKFFCIQVKMIQKRWWVLQAVILMMAWIALDLSQAAESMQRVMSVTAVLFVILIMPELWKNRETNSMEIEQAAFYSLRQIYSARLLAFGFVDACILNIFCFTAVNTQQIPAQDLLKQFIFPLLAAAGICFSVFCSSKRFSEVTAIFSCIIVNGLLTLLVINEAVYAKITPLLWGALFVISSAVVVISIRKIICGCDTLWEVRKNDVNFE